MWNRKGACQHVLKWRWSGNISFSFFFFDFPGRRKPPPRHASTPFCGVAMLTIEFDQLEVPCSERGRTYITFHCLRHSWTVKLNIQQVELNLVVFFVGGCPCNVSSVRTTASFGPTMWGLAVTGGSSFERAWVKGSKSYCVELDIVSMASLIVYLWITGSVIKPTRTCFLSILNYHPGLGFSGHQAVFFRSPCRRRWPIGRIQKTILKSLSRGWSFGSMMEQEQKDLMLSCAMLRCLLGLRFVEPHTGAEIIWTYILEHSFGITSLLDNPWWPQVLPREHLHWGQLTQRGSIFRCQHLEFRRRVNSMFTMPAANPVYESLADSAVGRCR